MIALVLFALSFLELTFALFAIWPSSISATHRVKRGWNDEMRRDQSLKGIRGKRLTYRWTREAANIQTMSG